MLLLQTIASNVGFRDPAANRRRTDLFRELLTVARDRRADAVLLPGGYWTVARPADVESVARRLADDAAGTGLTLIAGIDVQSGQVKGKQSKGGAKPALPYFAFVSRALERPKIWRQTSSDSRNVIDVADDEVPGAGRVVPVGSATVGVLICGELFSRRARSSMASLSPTLVVDLGHESMGTGVTRSMERIAADGRCAVAHTQHVTPHSQGSLHFVTRVGNRQSIPLADSPWVGDDDLWIAYQVREC